MTRLVVVAGLAGALFGAGLAGTGMCDPARVQGFLDLFGRWDPTLVFVMAGALLPIVIAWRLLPRLARPLFADGSFDLPDTTRLDARLALGALLFGVGWGICGLCPGPALAALALEPARAGAFVLAMLGGMALVPRSR